MVWIRNIQNIKVPKTQLSGLFPSQVVGIKTFRQFAGTLWAKRDSSLDDKLHPLEWHSALSSTGWLFSHLGCNPVLNPRFQFWMTFHSQSCTHEKAWSWHWKHCLLCIFQVLSLCFTYNGWHGEKLQKNTFCFLPDNRIDSTWAATLHVIEMEICKWKGKRGRGHWFLCNRFRWGKDYELIELVWH